MTEDMQKAKDELFKNSQATLGNTSIYALDSSECGLHKEYAICVFGYWMPAVYEGFSCFKVPQYELDLLTKYLGFEPDQHRFMDVESFKTAKYVRKFKEVQTPAVPTTAAKDAVNHPSHYDLFADGSLETVDAIQKLLTPEEYAGYLKGNILKYRLRAGNKDDTLQDIAKAKKYNEFLADHIKE